MELTYLIAILLGALLGHCYTYLIFAGHSPTRYATLARTARLPFVFGFFYYLLRYTNIPLILVGGTFIGMVWLSLLTREY